MGTCTQIPRSSPEIPRSKDNFKESLVLKIIVTHFLIIFIGILFYNLRQKRKQERKGVHPNSGP